MTVHSDDWSVGGDLQCPGTGANSHRLGVSTSAGQQSAAYDTAKRALMQFLIGRVVEGTLTE